MGSQGKLRSPMSGELDGVVLEPSSGATSDSRRSATGSGDDVLVTPNFRDQASNEHLTRHGHLLRGKIRLFGHFVPVQMLVLALVEFVLFSLASVAVITSLMHRGQLALAGDAGFTGLTQAVIIASMVTLSLGAVGLYSAHQRAEWGGLLTRVALTFVVAVPALWLVYLAVPAMAVEVPVMATAVLASIAVLGLTRPLFYRYVDGAMMIRRVLVLGTGERARMIEGLRRKSDQRGFQIVGFIPPRQRQSEVLVDPAKVVTSSASFCAYAIEHDVDEIVVALDDRRSGAIPTNELLNCRMSGLDVIDILDFFERETAKIRLDLLQPGWLIHSEGFKRHLVRDFSKRFFDITLSVALLLLTLPLTAATALAIMIESRGKGSVLYRQQRVGRGGKVFNLIKFRSMRMDAESDGQAKWAAADDPRITRVGRIIRKSRIDELPQLWNVLRNEMSIVGPRPERPEFIARLNGINPLYKERHRVKPGIAGWAQLRYPYGASEKDAIEKLQYDLYYVKNYRVLFDLYILIQTVEVVLLGKGAR